MYTPPAAFRRCPRLLLLLLTALLAWGTLAAAGNADGGADWSLSPAPTDGENGRGEGSFAWLLEPGSVIEDSVVVSNKNPTSLQLTVGARDAITTADGHLDLAPDDAAPTGLASWISLDVETLDIPPGESVTVPFTITVPADAAPGDYSGGITTSFAGQGTTVAVNYRLSNRVDVRIPGELAVSHEVTDLQVDLASTWSLTSPSEATVTYTLTNTGNARLYSNETIRVSGPLGIGARTSSHTLPEVLPGASIQHTVTVPAWALGWNSIEVTSRSAGVDEQSGSTHHEKEPAAAVSWSWLLVFAAITAAGITLGVRRGRRPARTLESPSDQESR